MILLTLDLQLKSQIETFTLIPQGSEGDVQVTSSIFCPENDNRTNGHIVTARLQHEGRASVMSECLANLSNFFNAVSQLAEHSDQDETNALQSNALSIMSACCEARIDFRAAKDENNHKDTQFCSTVLESL